MSRKPPARSKARATGRLRRTAPRQLDKAVPHTLDCESNIEIADDGQVEIDCLSARQKIEEREMRRRLWARVHWLDAFDLTPRR